MSYCVRGELFCYILVLYSWKNAIFVAKVVVTKCETIFTYCYYTFQKKNLVINLLHIWKNKNKNRAFGAIYYTFLIKKILVNFLLHIWKNKKKIAISLLHMSTTYSTPPYYPNSIDFAEIISKKVFLVHYVTWYCIQEFSRIFDST